MKKVVSVLLAVLMIFSVFSATVAFAEGEESQTTYTVNFVDYNNDYISSAVYQAGEKVVVPPNPTRASDEKADYIFKGWAVKDSGSDTLYHSNTIPNATADVTYIAVYGEQLKEDIPNLMQFFRSIFARINAIFEYFARIFSREWPKN